MNWDNVKQDYISVYVDTFTEQELKGIIGFYKSPAGKAFVKKSPEMMKRSMDISQKRNGETRFVTLVPDKEARQ